MCGRGAAGSAAAARGHPNPLTDTVKTNATITHTDLIHLSSSVRQSADRLQRCADLTQSPRRRYVKLAAPRRIPKLVVVHVSSLGPTGPYASAGPSLNPDRSARGVDAVHTRSTRSLMGVGRRWRRGSGRGARVACTGCAEPPPALASPLPGQSGAR